MTTKIELKYDIIERLYGIFIDGECVTTIEDAHDAHNLFNELYANNGERIKTIKHTQI